MENKRSESLDSKNGGYSAKRSTELYERRIPNPDPGGGVLGHFPTLDNDEFLGCCKSEHGDLDGGSEHQLNSFRVKFIDSLSLWPAVNSRSIATSLAAPFKASAAKTCSPSATPTLPLISQRNYRSALPSPRCAVSDSETVQVQEMAAEDAQDPRLARIASAIRVIPDFPKPGIMFQDITTLLLDTQAFKDTIDLFVERYKDKEISVVAGIEARGFIFGPPIALAIGAKFVPMRKPNKLPGKVISEEYSLEYGTDTMEMHVGAVEAGERALVIDDLIATGGTLGAAIKLLERVGVKVVECACVIALPELKGRERLGDNPLFVLVNAPGA